MGIIDEALGLPSGNSLVDEALKAPPINTPKNIFDAKLEEIRNRPAAILDPLVNNAQEVYHGAQLIAGGANKGIAGMIGLPGELIRAGAALGGVNLPSSSEWISKNIMPSSPTPERGNTAEQLLYAGGEQIPATLAAIATGGTSALIKPAIGAAVASGLTRTIAPDSPTADVIAQFIGAMTPYGMQKGIGALANTQLPERLYGSATRMPLSKKWLATLPREEQNIRQRAVEAGLQSEVPPSEYGAAKAAGISRSAKDQVENIVDTLTSQGLTKPTAEILDRGLGKAYELAAQSNDPVGASAYVNAWKEAYTGGRGETMTPREIQDSKLFNQKASNYNNPDMKAEHAQIQEAITKGMAHETMLTLEEMDPSLQSLNRTSATYKQLEEAITRAYSREGNTNLAKLGTKVLIAGKNPVLGLMDHVLGLPAVKARMAFALKAARIQPAAPMTNMTLEPTPGLYPEVNEPGPYGPVVPYAGGPYKPVPSQRFLDEQAVKNAFLEKQRTMGPQPIATPRSNISYRESGSPIVSPKNVFPQSQVNVEEPLGGYSLDDIIKIIQQGGQ